MGLMNCSDQLSVQLCVCLWVVPDHSRRVPEDGGGEALGDAHQTGPIHLHDLVIHLDPDTHTDESSISFRYRCSSHTKSLTSRHKYMSELHYAAKLQQDTQGTNRPIMHINIIFKIATVPDFLSFFVVVTNPHCDSSRLFCNQETEEMRLKTNQGA